MDPWTSEMQFFLNNLDLPKLSKQAADTLDTPLTFDELYKALNQMPNNTSPGPDDLPTEFRKHFWCTQYLHNFTDWHQE